MNLLSVGASLASDADHEMARGPVNSQAVDSYTRRLAAARTDERAFDPVLQELKADSTLRARDVVAVAKAYAGRGKAIGSKKAALEAIERKFVEIVRFEKKNDIARSARPW